VFVKDSRRTFLQGYLCHAFDGIQKSRGESSRQSEMASSGEGCQYFQPSALATIPRS